MVRIVVGIALVLITGALITVEGLSTTSGLIEVGVFVFGIASWMAAGSLTEPGAVTAEDLSGENVNLKQTGPSVSTRRVKARGDVEIQQKSTR